MALIEVRRLIGNFPCSMCKKFGIVTFTIGYSQSALCQEHLDEFKDKLKKVT